MLTDYGAIFVMRKAAAADQGTGWSLPRQLLLSLRVVCRTRGSCCAATAPRHGRRSSLLLAARKAPHLAAPRPGPVRPGRPLRPCAGRGLARARRCAAGRRGLTRSHSGGRGRDFFVRSRSPPVVACRGSRCAAVAPRRGRGSRLQPAARTSPLRALGLCARAGLFEPLT